MWNSLVATQPPASAPAMPIRQVMTRPCDLLPGISILASKPAPRPRTIHAKMPITDSLVRDVSGVPGRSVLPGSFAAGQAFPRGFPPSFGPVVGPAGPEWSVSGGVLDLGAGLL